jgi:LuxR family transcriptional regulator, quorum-sensing system regulator BjaR1
MKNHDPAAFNRQLRRLTTPQECGRVFGSLIADFGFDTFACGQVDLEHRERNAFYVIEWPERWTRFYTDSGLIERDPVVGELGARQVPFTWSDLKADRKFSQVGREALTLAASFGWTEGLVVPMPEGGNRFGLVSMAGSRLVDAEQRDLLAVMGVCLYTHVRTLVAREGCAIPPAGLTPREIECISLVAQGHPDRRIADKLGIAASTAHEHVEKAKRKLKARSRGELLAIAVALAIVEL